MIYQLYDSRLDYYFGEQRRMGEDAAVAANRDLYLQGETAIGWKAVEREPEVRPKKVAPKKTSSPPDGLADALVALGYGKSEAKRLASQFDGGTIEDCIRQLMVNA